MKIQRPQLRNSMKVKLKTTLQSHLPELWDMSAATYSRIERCVLRKPVSGKQHQPKRNSKTDGNTQRELTPRSKNNNYHVKLSTSPPTKAEGNAETTLAPTSGIEANVQPIICLCKSRALNHLFAPDQDNSKIIVSKGTKHRQGTLTKRSLY